MVWPVSASYKGIICGGPYPGYGINKNELDKILKNNIIMLLINRFTDIICLDINSYFKEKQIWNDLKE